MYSSSLISPSSLIVGKSHTEGWFQVTISACAGHVYCHVNLLKRVGARTHYYTV